MAALSLTGKVALVTGGSKGIGRATSLRLAREGANVVINYSSSSAAANEVVSEIGNDRAIAVQANAGSVKDIEKLIAATVEKWGRIDILVPCAGVMKLNELSNVTEEQFDETFNLNVKGPLFLAQVCNFFIYLEDFPHIALLFEDPYIRLWHSSTLNDPYTWKHQY